MYHYTYKTVNLINQKYYYGIHSTDNLDDGYIGSGRRLRLAIKKYGKSNFSKEILDFYETRESASLAERNLITEFMVNDDNCYNLNYGGENKLARHSVATKAKISAKNAGENNPRYGKTWTDEERKKLCGMAGKTHSPEAKAKMSSAGLGRKTSDEARSNMSKAQTGLIKKRGRKLSEETKAKMRKPKAPGFGALISALKTGVPMSESAKANMRKPKEYKEIKCKLDINRKVASYDNDRNIVKVYTNYVEALDDIGRSFLTSFVKAVGTNRKSNKLYWDYI